MVKKKMVVKKKKLLMVKKKKIIVKKKMMTIVNKRKKTTYKLKFINSYRFMSSKILDLVDNLSEIFNKECGKCMKREN